MLNKKAVKEVLQMVADFDPKDEFWNEFINHPEVGYLENRAIDSLKDVRTVARIIEEKNPKSYSFTKAQLDTFPKLCANGSGVWVLVAATYSEYKKLWCPPNWYQYLQVMK